MIKALMTTMKPESFLISFVAVITGAALASLYGPMHWGR